MTGKVYKSVEKSSFPNQSTTYSLDKPFHDEIMLVVAYFRRREHSCWRECGVLRGILNTLLWWPDWCSSHWRQWLTWLLEHTSVSKAKEMSIERNDTEGFLWISICCWTFAIWWPGSLPRVGRHVRYPATSDILWRTLFLVARRVGIVMSVVNLAELLVR
jgi:hypothetical protein